MTQTVLMIDDNPADAVIVKRLLAKIPGSTYSFLHAENAETGFESLRQQSIDCIVLDYQLGRISGIELLHQMRSAGIDVPVIALTGEGSESIAVDTLKAGAQDYLVKGQVTAATLHRSILSATKTVALERKLREQREELLSFTGMVSHDLRNPLRHICQYSELLQLELTNSDDHCRRYVEAIDKACKRMSTLIENLLSYTKYGRSAKQLTDVDLTEVLRVATTDLSAVIESSNASVQFDELPAVTGDPTGLSQLFQNLIGNGIKYNHSPRPSIVIQSEHVDDRINVTVIDNGIGIDEQYLDDVFRPLCRLHTEEEYEGSGLGLSTAQRIAHQHDATITIGSKLGEGTAVCLSFPAGPKR
ncbi:hybrid sensor histidine kinase/response regulator [Roseiconus lacunae]|uniref:hybrid sensor histidine kinase/response regulator n=1 Tax=Roseiconus lacunae TaxID=2605694 RepID=UPI001E40F680|nr:hybrid sensor histidine kinase/response regulator [Roseiconus lacunae]MCD0458262.1 response regulator [Roseiconus lacunae]